MPEASTSHPPDSVRWRPTQTRIGRALLFVAIVWSIAGAFQVLFYGFPWLLDRAVKDGWIADTLVTVKPLKPNDCVTQIQNTPQPALDATGLRRTRVAVYEVGFILGLATGARNAGAAGEADPAPSREARAALALELGLPIPEIPPLHRTADALREFEVHMAADPQCIGARLAKGFSVQHDALYRFGALAGHSMVYRSAAPQVGALFVPALRQYGKAAGLPEHVWRPLTDPPSGQPGPQAQAEARAVVGRIHAYLQDEIASGDGALGR